MKSFVFSVISILPYLLDLRSMAMNGGSEDLVELWAEDVIKCVEAVCVLSLFKHRCLSSWTVRTLQGRTARSEEIKNKRMPDCCVCWDWALITLSSSCQDHDDDNWVLCSLTRIIEYPDLEGTHKDHGVQFLSLHRMSPKVASCVWECCPNNSKILSVSVDYKAEVTETFWG